MDSDGEPITITINLNSKTLTVFASYIFKPFIFTKDNLV